MQSVLRRALAVAHTLADIADQQCKQTDAQQKSNAIATAVKGDKTFVTALDQRIERAQRECIEAHFPDHGIWGEEERSVALHRPWVWTLDPIDGTMAYVCGMQVYSTLISLCYEGKPVLGIMHFPATSERWVGVQGQVTTLNGQPCRTRHARPLSDAVMSASSPDFFKTLAQKTALECLVAQTAWRVYGGAAMSYGRLASGLIDLSLDAGLHIYDYAAMVPIIEGAGGVITDWQGKPLHLHSDSQVLAASQREVHAQALALLATPDNAPLISEIS